MRKYAYPNKPHMFHLATPSLSQSSNSVPSLKSKARRHRRRSQPDNQLLQASAAPQTAGLQVTIGTDGRFVLNPYHRIEVFPPEINPNWYCVRRLSQLTETPSICPICQYCPPSLPYAGPCGHPYCLLCLLSLISNLGKCSVCGDLLHVRDLRPVQFLPISAIRQGEEASFALLTKPKAGFGGVYQACEGREREAEGLPNATFRRFNRVTTYREDGDLQALERLFDDTEGPEISAMLRELIANHTNSTGNPAENRAEAVLDPAVYYYFYQSADGQPYFLSPLTDQILLAEFHYRWNYPQQLRCPVLAIEHAALTIEKLREYRFLKHFTVGETVYLVDLDLSFVCSQAVLSLFSGELEAKELQRKSKARKEAVALALGKQLREPLAGPLSAVGH